MKELLPRERFIRALRREPVDRVPLLYRMKHEAKSKLARVYGIEDASTGRKHDPELELRLGNDTIIYQVGAAPPIGICGSGLIDAIAKMLAAGVLDASGRLRIKAKESLPPILRDRLVKAEGKEAFVLAWAGSTGKDEDITLTQTDIRQLQLAKGAICSGVVTLQKVMGVADSDIEELMLCGGFGNYINTESAVRIRLLPELPLERITYYGNAAALGAQMALLSETERARAEELAREISHVSLASQPDFQDVFVEALKFQDVVEAKSPVAVEG